MVFNRRVKGSPHPVYSVYGDVMGNVQHHGCHLVKMTNFSTSCKGKNLLTEANIQCTPRIK